MASTSAVSEDVKLTQDQETIHQPVVSNNASGNDRIDTGVTEKTYPTKQPLELQSIMDEKNMCTIPKIQHAKNLSIETKRLIYKEYNEGLSEENLARKYNTVRKIVCYIVRRHNEMYMDRPEYPLELRARKEKQEASKNSISKTHSARDLSLEMRHQLYKEYNEGVSPEELARKYNTGHQVVHYIGNYCPALVSHETKNLICDDYKSGATIEELASKYEFNCSTINYLLVRRGVIRKRSRKRKIREGNNFTKQKIQHAAICTQYNAGISIEALVKKYNLSPCTVNWILKKSARNKYYMPKELKVKQGMYCYYNNKKIPHTYIDMAPPMADEVPKIEIEIKTELENLDEEDEFEKLIERKDMLNKSDCEIEISLESNEMTSVPRGVIVKTEQESDSLCHSLNENVCIEFEEVK